MKQRRMKEGSRFRRNRKKHLTICVFGQVMGGKSTLVGELVFHSGRNCGLISDDVFRKIDVEVDQQKISHEPDSIAEQPLASELRTKTPFFQTRKSKYSIILDNLPRKSSHWNLYDGNPMNSWRPTERKVYEARRHSSEWIIRCRKYDITLIDVPGHEEYLTNAITGISQSDAGLLVVDAGRGSFETGINQWRRGITRRHSLIAFCHSVKQLIVVVNKMDSVDFDVERYDHIIQQTCQVLLSVGYNVTKIPFIPISAIEGINITQATTNPNMNWWRSGKTDWGGNTLLETINSLKHPRRRKLAKKPLRIPIYKVIPKISSINSHVYMGRITSGTLRKGMGVIFAPSGDKSTVLSIHRSCQNVNEAMPGDFIAFSVTGSQKGMIKRGHVLGSCEGSVNDTPHVVELFEAMIIVLDHPGKISVGYTPFMDCHTSHFSCRFEEILEKNDKISGITLEKNPEFLVKGDGARIILRPLKDVVLETISDIPRFARFTLRDGAVGGTKSTYVAVGVVKKILKRRKLIKGEKTDWEQLYEDRDCREKFLVDYCLLKDGEEEEEFEGMKGILCISIQSRNLSLEKIFKVLLI